MKLFDFKENVYPSQPDPFSLKGEDGKYYIYSSARDGVRGFVSENLDGEYTDLGYVFRRENKLEYWAPCVIYTEGKYYMYVSCIDKDETDVHMQTLQVAVSDTPNGPFEYLNDIIEPFSIDAHVVKSGGDLYIFYSSNDYEAERAGTYILVDKMLSPTKCAGKPVAVVKPTLDEEIFMRDRFKKGQHWHTLEGACYFREGNDIILSTRATATKVNIITSVMLTQARKVTILPKSNLKSSRAMTFTCRSLQKMI